MDFPDSSVGKVSICNAGDLGWIPGSGRSAGEGIGYNTPEFLGFPVAQLLKNHLQCGRPGFDPRLGRSPQEGKGYPL